LKISITLHLASVQQHAKAVVACKDSNNSRVPGISPCNGRSTCKGSSSIQTQLQQHNALCKGMTTAACKGSSMQSSSSNSIHFHMHDKRNNASQSTLHQQQVLDRNAGAQKHHVPSYCQIVHVIVEKCISHIMTSLKPKAPRMTSAWQPQAFQQSGQTFLAPSPK